MKRRLRKLGVILGVLMVACCLIGLLAHISAKGPVEEYKEQLWASGEKLTVAELIPPPLPPEQNSAAVFRQVIAILSRMPRDLLDTNPPGSYPIAPGKKMSGWQQSHIVDAGYDEPMTNTWDEAIQAVALRGP